MPTVYGTNSSFDTMRTAVATQMTALVNAMIAGSIVPRFAATGVYSTHWAEPMLVFNSVSIGIPSIEMEFPAMKGSPAGSVINMICTVELRVLTGNTPDYLDEITVARLCNSIVNWLEIHRGTFGTGIVVWKTAQVETAVRFTDTDTIGGRVRFTLRTTEAFVAA